MILSSPLKAFQARIGSSPHGLSGLRLRSHRKLSCDSQAPILQHTATDQLQETGQTDKILSVPPLKSPISASRFLAVLEGACLAGALLLQVYVLRAAKLNQQGLSRGDTTVFLLTLALAIRFLHRLWNRQARRGDALEDSRSVTASGALRLHRLELLHTRQATALASIERELSKSRLRLHSIRRDLQPGLRQVQAESTVHADGLVSVAKKLEAMGAEINDTRELLSQLQGASLKQLQLVIQALQMARAMPVPNGEDTIVQE